MANLPRGSAQCRYDSGETYGSVTPTYDTAVANAPFSDCIMAVGDMFEASYTSSSLYVSFNAGSIAKVGGSFWVLKSSASIQLEANMEQYICLTIDKGQQDGSKADITLKTLSQIQKGVLYASGTIRDLPIYKVTTNASGVSTIVDMRKVVKESYLLTEAEYEALTPEQYAIYNILED